jgi:hypothetical protein
MNEDARVIQECVQILANGSKRFKNAQFFIGEVTSVNEDDRECDVTAVLGQDETEYSGAHLSPERNDGWIEIPEVGSSAFCAKLANNEVYVLKCSDVSKIICYIDSGNKFEFSASGFIWNGGSFGGMAKTGVLATKLNNLENDLNTLKTAISAWVPVASDGGAALKLALATWYAATLTNTTQASISDDKIKH